MDKNKIQRMRNLVSGNYGSKTKKQTGYKKYKNKKSEGEIWQEGGRTWTIKNGIKQNIRKLDKAREYGKIPLSCPQCNGPMNKSQHKFMYIRYGHCLFCQTKAEHKMRNEGTYDNWLIENVKKNFVSWKKKKQDAFNDYLKNINSKHYITESGLIEDWSEMSNDTKEYMLEKFNEFIKSEENNLQELIEKQESNK
tara:strand:- start:1484 stop:2068 length:585 start_codon:yes stop_codon:yes gene_type:complete